MVLVHADLYTTQSQIGLSILAFNFSNTYFSCQIFVILIGNNSTGDARIPQPGEIVFNTMIYRRIETVQRSGDFQSK